MIIVASDGAVIADLSARADGTMGGMAISYPKVERGIELTCAAAQDLWGLLPDSYVIGEVAAAVCVPNANHNPLTLSGQVGGSMRVPTIRTPLLAPNPPIIVDRSDVATAATTRRLAVSLKQAFADNGAVID